MRIIRNTVGRALMVLLVISGILAAGIASAHAQFVYSHLFEEGVIYTAGTPQYDDWISFRESLPASGITEITLNGSRDPIGRSCFVPAIAQQIADAMRAAGAVSQPTETINLSVDCGGFTWVVGACDNGVLNNLMLRALGGTDSLAPCSCQATYAIGPAITDGDWGGIDGPICAAPTQTITVTVLTTDSTPLSSIPTLSEWGLIAMAGVLGIAGYFVVRRRKAAA